jgi:hypothetical protein
MLVNVEGKVSSKHDVFTAAPFLSMPLRFALRCLCYEQLVALGTAFLWTSLVWICCMTSWVSSGEKSGQPWLRNAEMKQFGGWNVCEMSQVVPLTITLWPSHTCWTWVHLICVFAPTHLPCFHILSPLMHASGLASVSFNLTCLVMHFKFFFALTFTQRGSRKCKRLLFTAHYICEVEQIQSISKIISETSQNHKSNPSTCIASISWRFRPTILGLDLHHLANLDSLKYFAYKVKTLQQIKSVFPRIQYRLCFRGYISLR